MLAMHPTETVRKDPGEPERKSEATMNAPTLYPTPPHRGVRRALALLVAVLLASLAFGVGLPWIMVDAPPQAETLWAREIQSRAPLPPRSSPRPPHGGRPRRAAPIDRPGPSGRDALARDQRRHGGDRAGVEEVARRQRHAERVLPTRAISANACSDSPPRSK